MCWPLLQGRARWCAGPPWFWQNHLFAHKIKHSQYKMLRSGGADDDSIKSGSLVIVYERHDSMRALYVDENKTHNNRFGSFPMKVCAQRNCKQTS